MTASGDSGGIDAARVAEVIATVADTGIRRRGSGYRLSASAVLTAAHVIRDAQTILVRFNADQPDEWTTEGTVEQAEAPSTLPCSLSLLDPPIVSSPCSSVG